MTDHPVSAQERLAALLHESHVGLFMNDECDAGTCDHADDALVLSKVLARVSVPAEPGAPDPRPVLAVCPECGRSDEHAAPCTAAHWMRLASYAPRPVTAPEPTRKPCGCIPPYQWCTRCDDGSVPAPEPSALLDVERLGASISAVEDSLVRRGLMDRLTSMDNFVLAEMVAREYLAATPQDREP